MSSKLSFAAAFLLLRQRIAPCIGLACEGNFLYSLSDFVTSLHFVAICGSRRMCQCALGLKMGDCLRNLSHPQADSSTILGTFDLEANFVTESMSLEGILGIVSEWSGHR